ncbi:MULTISPECIES: endonuclease/exonuclease/phosphatase family protein [unclassified Duganella]|uniref:endonuclease/exonuclease/phosphatase family protein n=1 Tax=unclassified Duganella TaxID=2636909 RepID=UPI0008893862|nr:MULTISPECIES: endonuclease/exonuclease/phosphatase family protein [unclassified Duganella]SDF91829.1 Endonuclease/Exonuclease/phosphatase family protein [Duganella sp. OV458]SDJ13235.1 Endonuclease/Exonuclease/phosphatase family protein [Duganella sp. OV510]
MQQEIRFATFNVCNLSQPGAKLYDNLAPLTEAEYAAKVAWTAQQLDQLNADVIGLQEIFSLDALRDVLAHSERYRHATLAGFEPPADPATGLPRVTPELALISRLPLAAPAQAYIMFPDGVALPDGSRDADRFARAPLHAQIVLPDERIVDVIVVHLKSKRPDYQQGDSGDAPMLHAQANLRSLIRRGTEAVALRALLSAMDKAIRRPRIVLGDFNDTVDAVTTHIVMGAGAACEPGEELHGQLFDCRQIQSGRERRRDAGYTIAHEGRHATIDHVLVSEEFNPASHHAIGEVVDVTYLNQHLIDATPAASDHGQVLATLRLY